MLRSRKPTVKLLQVTIQQGEGKVSHRLNHSSHKLDHSSQKLDHSQKLDQMQEEMKLRVRIHQPAAMTLVIS